MEEEDVRQGEKGREGERWNKKQHGLRKKRKRNRKGN